MKKALALLLCRNSLIDFHRNFRSGLFHCVPYPLFSGHISWNNRTPQQESGICIYTGQMLPTVLSSFSNQCNCFQLPQLGCRRSRNTGTNIYWPL